jgi:hypothetical protein
MFVSAFPYLFLIVEAIQIYNTSDKSIDPEFFVLY